MNTKKNVTLGQSEDQIPKTTEARAGYKILYLNNEVWKNIG